MVIIQIVDAQFLLIIFDITSDCESPFMDWTLFMMGRKQDPQFLMRMSPTTSVCGSVLIDFPKALIHVQLASWDPFEKGFALNGN